MIKNYLKIAFRNLRRNKSYALINTSGLAVGIGACLLLFLVIQFETSFDTFHSNKKNIYRVVSEFQSPEGINYSSGVPFPTADALRNDFPQIKNIAAIYGTRNEQITIPAKGPKAKVPISTGISLKSIFKNGGTSGIGVS